jgi:hypothetical protein
MPSVGSGGAQWFTEWLATFALVVAILRSSLRAGIRALAHGLDLVRKSIARSLTNTFSGSTGRQDHDFCTDANIGTRSIPIESGAGSDEAMEEGREQEADPA